MNKAALRGKLQTVLRELSEQVSDPSILPLAAATATDALASVPGGEAVTKPLVRQMASLLNEQWILTADLCTVFSVLASLHAHQPAAVQGRYLACALKRLMSCELAPGGPYQSRPGQVEPSANAAVARFLRRYDVALPQLTQYLDGQAIGGAFGLDTVNEEVFWYLVAPVLSAPAQAALMERLSRRPRTAATRQAGAIRPMHTHKTALRLVTLCLLGGDCQSDAALLEQPVRSFTFYRGMQAASHKLITNALLAEALAIAVRPPKRQAAAVVGDTQLHADILRDTKRYVADLPSELRKTGMAAWDAMRRADRNHEIVLMPQLFADTLKDVSPASIGQLRILGAANFFCWIAAMIYDDFIDEEGEPARLPVANTAYRLSLSLYRQALAARPALNRYVEHVYDEMDAANAWEVAHTRALVADGTIRLPVLPDYGDCTVLAQRALGHVIGPMLVTMLLPGIRPKQIDAINRAMQHFLIARQLNDDLHDWRKDLQVGHLSPVVIDLLRGAQIGPGTYVLTELIPRLEQYFFAHGLYDACSMLQTHISECRQALGASGICSTAGGFTLLLDNIDASAAAAIGIQADEQAFLDAYRELAPQV